MLINYPCACLEKAKRSYDRITFIFLSYILINSTKPSSKCLISKCLKMLKYTKSSLNKKLLRRYIKK